MSISVIINGVDEAVGLAAATSFTIASSALVTADYFKVDENAIVHRLGPSGDYLPATNKDGAIALSAFPNMAVIDGPAKYKITKSVTAVDAYVGYEE